MKRRDKPHDDPTLSALDCGCDPRENHKCARHSDERRCVMGHWIRRENCPACQVLVKESENK